jgi:DeoR family suf operon transcriptional repressor
MIATSMQPNGSEGPLPGFKGPKGTLLMELKKARTLSAKELAFKLGLSLNAVRHHLKELIAEQLVEAERRQQGVGAPAFAYRLTEAGEALFPRRYEGALNDLLDHVVAREGRARAVAVLESRYVELTRQLQAQLGNAAPAERLEAVARALSAEGYMAEAVSSPEQGRLTEHNCAIHAVAQRFPEICAAEARFLADVLGAAVERRQHILSGCRSCEYHVRFPPQAESKETFAPLSQGLA